MATYTELAAIADDAGFDALVAKIRVACVDKAVNILAQATPTASQVEWAQSALNRPAASADSVLWYVVVANKAATVAQIVGATDNAVQTNVDAAVDKIAGV